MHGLGNFQVHVEDTGSTATFYVDTDVAPETRYVYRIKARNAGGLSKRSHYFDANTPAAPDPALNHPATGVPTISGLAQVGETLTADTSGIEDEGGLEGGTFGYQWSITLGTASADIPGATEAAYIPTATDEGLAIRVRVSFTDDAGNTETLTSAATAAVAVRPNSPATGVPIIRGTVQVGETLTADTSGIEDADGLANVSYSYQWIANDGTSETDITGNTNSTYTLIAADEGKTIKVRVSFTDDASNGEWLTSAATEEVETKPNSPATGALTITGRAQVGEMLTVDTSGIADVDGLDEVSYSHQWVSNDGNADTDITGATEFIYILVAADKGKTIKVRVTFTDDGGNDESLTSAATATVEAEPQEPPAKPAGLTGTVAHDDVSLTWDDPEDASITGYQILRLDRDVHGLGNFQVHVDDTGSAATSYIDRNVAPETRYVYRIKARNAAGLSPRSDYFNANTPVASNNPATGVPTISGIVHVDELLTADTSGIEDADGLDDVVFSYQWLAADAAIQGATQATYTLAASDEGKTVMVRVSFTDDAGNDESLTSAATTAVVAAKPNSPATGAPAISGTAQVGETLTAGTSAIEDEDGLTNVSYSYQWVANDGTTDTDIAGATDSTYTLVSSDEGRTVRVRVSFTDDEGNEETLSSAATEAVAAKPNSPATGAPAISGTAQVGETLTAGTSAIEDEDGLDDAVFSYQWLADDVELQGATEAAYTMVSSDEGKPIKVRVSFTDDAGHQEILTSAATAAVAGEPEPPAKPTGLTGTVAHDQVSLTWNDPGDESITGYQILRLDRDVHGLGNFQVHVDDTGGAATSYTDWDVAPETRYVYRIKARNAAGLSVRSHYFGANTPPAPNTPATGVPTITGTAQVGETLTANTSGIGDADGLDNVVFSYQWVATDGGRAELDIEGATGASYTLIDIDAALRFMVRVSFTDDAGNEETLTSEATAVVARAK